MNCFYHPNQPAVGICKSCNRGLCGECAAEVGKAMACRDRCEEDLRAVQALIEANVRTRGVGAQLVKSSSTALFVAGTFVAVTGAGFVYFGSRLPRESPFFVGLGVLFILYGAYQFVRALKLRSAGSK